MLRWVNGVSRLNELIKGMCPDGVEYVSLEDVCLISKGVQFNKKDMNDTGTYPVINGGVNPSGYIEQYNQEENTITISQGGASAGFVNWLETKFWAGAHCYILKPTDNVLNRYLFHFVKSKEYKLQECQYGAGIPALAKSTVASLKIPVPPIEIQSEIVYILDNFTELTSKLTEELSAELTARKKQYEYYRDKLLTFDCTIDKIRIKDVANIYRGKRVVKSDLSENGEYAVYQNALSPMGYYNSKNRNGGSVYLIAAGAAGSIGFSENDFWAADDCYTFECNEKITQKYLFYVLLNNQSLINSKVRKASIPRISKESIENIEIPLPSLDVQNRLVDVLDNFNSLCNDLTKGLPAEIEMRIKQYEYYRDSLLNFKMMN